MQPDLVEAAAAPEALAPLRFQHQQGQALAAGFAGARDDDDEIGGVAIGDERLLAVEHDRNCRRFLALVRTACRSEPAPGSVMAIAPMNSPRAIFGSQRCFCSCEP